MDPEMWSAKGPEQLWLCLLFLHLVRCQSIQAPVPPSTHLSITSAILGQSCPHR